MKRVFLLLMLAFVAMSCEEIQDFIDNKGHGLVFLEGEMKAYFPDKGDTKNYKFNADLAWSAEASADWVVVNPTSGEAGENKIQIKVDKNKSEERRTGYVDITLSNEQSYRIELEQLAAGENLDDVTPSVSIPSNEIWYTSTDGNIVEPYSGEGCEDNLTVFGANVVSNTYVDGKGVIVFDGDVTSIGFGAFNECVNLAYMVIPDSVTAIGDYAFADCTSLTSVTIPDSVTTIGEGAYCRCTKLQSITWGKGVETVGGYAFCNCDSLTSITIPDSVTTIGEGAFYECISLTSVTIGDSVTTIGEGTFYKCISLTSVTIPDSVTIIRYATFAFCSSLTSVSIPDSVTTIGDFAFYECTSLTSVTMGKGVETVGGYAFCNCDSLTDVTIGDSVTTIGDSAFSSCDNLTNITIPDSVTTIGGSAFLDCSSLTSVTMGKGVETVGGYAFMNCSSLNAVHISDLTLWCNIDFVNPISNGFHLVANPLYYARNLYLNGELITELVIPESVTEIKFLAFTGCSASNIVFHDNVKSIGPCAF